MTLQERWDLRPEIVLFCSVPRIPVFAESRRGMQYTCCVSEETFVTVKYSWRCSRALAGAQSPGPCAVSSPTWRRPGLGPGPGRGPGPGPRSFALNPILSKVNISKTILCPHADFRQSQYIKKTILCPHTDTQQSQYTKNDPLLSCRYLAKSIHKKRSVALNPIFSKVNI